MKRCSTSSGTREEHIKTTISNPLSGSKEKDRQYQMLERITVENVNWWGTLENNLAVS